MKEMKKSTGIQLKSIIQPVTNFKMYKGRFAGFETRLAGIEGTLQQIVAHLQQQ
jgi:hypothetical protein